MTVTLDTPAPTTLATPPIIMALIALQRRFFRENIDTD